MGKAKQCLRCKGLWIGLSLAAIVVILLGFAVFDQSFYYDNRYYFADGIRFTLLFAGIGSVIFGSAILFKHYCFGEADWDTLGWAIGLSVVAIFLIMLAVYFIPMALDEWTIRGFDNNADLIQDFIETKLGCNTFLWHDDRAYYNVHVEFENIRYSSEAIDEKKKLCLGLDY